MMILQSMCYLTCLFKFWPDLKKEPHLRGGIYAQRKMLYDSESQIMVRR